jgi:hypothetical protein
MNLSPGNAHAPPLPAAHSHLELLPDLDSRRLRRSRGNWLPPEQRPAGEVGDRADCAAVSREALLEMRRIIEAAEVATRLLSLQDVTTARSLRQRLDSLDFLRQALDSSSALSALYVGYDNGDFFLLGRIGHGSAAERSRAPAGAAYVVQSIERAGAAPQGRLIYFDARLQRLREDDRPVYAADFDPRRRPWFQQGLASSTQVRTPPYLFYSSQKVGTTLARRSSSGRSVVGADILLDTLGATLARQKVTPTGEMVLVNSQGYALAYGDASRMLVASAADDGQPALARLDELGVPVLVPLLATVRSMQGPASRTLPVEVAGTHWRASINPLLLEGVPPLYLVSAIPEHELMADAYRLIEHSAIATLLVLLFTIPLTWGLARSISRSLGSLASQAEAIRHFDFAQPIAVHSSIREVSDLALTMVGMKQTIHRFLDISQAMAAEQNFDRLLPRLLADTISACGAAAGILYLAEDCELKPAVALDRAEVPLAGQLSAFGIDHAGPLLAAALADGMAHAAPLEAADRLRLGLAAAELMSASHAIAVPLINRKRELVGAMLLFCDSAPDSGRLSFVKALCGSAAVSLESKALIKAQKDLFEAFIQLIAAAIDAKSPYTGGHCARVPELTKMLAAAACAAKSGPYKDFALTDDDWESVHVAAWLHDCGKVTTPEYVVDKATKLETIHDRIHEVRMRFEVLKRDAEILCLQAIAAGEGEASARRRLAAELQRIDDDFSFVAACNEGGEFMAAAEIDRLQDDRQANLDAHARRPHRHLVGREARKAGTPGAALPVVEALLADKPEHLFTAASAGPDAGRQSLGISHGRSGAALQPGRTLQSGGRTRHAVGGGTLQDQRAHRADADHALAASFPQTPAAGARDRRWPPRENGRQRLPATTSARRNEPAGAHGGDRRHLRSVDRRRPALQEGQDPLRSDGHHVADAAGAAHRWRTVRPFPALGGLSRLRATIHAAGAD